MAQHVPVAPLVGPSSVGCGGTSSTGWFCLCVLCCGLLLVEFQAGPHLATTCTDSYARLIGSFQLRLGLGSNRLYSPRCYLGSSGAFAIHGIFSLAQPGRGVCFVASSLVAVSLSFPDVVSCSAFFPSSGAMFTI